MAGFGEVGDGRRVTTERVGVWRLETGDGRVEVGEVDGSATWVESGEKFGRVVGVAAWGAQAQSNAKAKPKNTFTRTIINSTRGNRKLARIPIWFGV